MSGTVLSKEARASDRAYSARWEIWRRAIGQWVQADDRPTIVGIFLISRLLLLGATILGAALHRPSFLTSPVTTPFWHTWQRWDAIHYAQIALHGYPHGDPTHLAAFFPLWALVLRLTLPMTGGDIAVAGLLMANCAWVIALYELAALSRELTDVATSRAVIIGLCAFPTALFGFVAYPESLFLALAIAAYRRMRAGHWLGAAILGLLAALTRQAGLFLMLPFFWEYLVQRQLGQTIRWDWRGIRADILLGLGPGIGVAIYAAFLWRTVGDPLAFLHAQASWHRFWAWPWQTIWWGFLDGLIQPTRYFAFRAWQEWLTVCAMLILAWRAIRRLPISATLYALPLLLLFLAQPVREWPLLSQSRFALELFPLFIVLGIWLARRRWRMITYVALCLPIQLGLMIVFSHAGWVI